LFNQKCAYCETNLNSNQPGDVEHYRPKGRLRDDGGAPVHESSPLGDKVHNGYWWLAYEWSNLLPSCIDCNRRRKHGEASEMAGKGDIFPVKRYRGFMPGEETQEEPLLIDPTADWGDPARHFQFDHDGKIKPTTEIGQETCRLLGLNLREGLVTLRMQRYKDAKNAFKALVQQILAGVGPEQDIDLLREINDMWEGKTPYSAFARAALEDERARLAARNVTMVLPRPIPDQGS
jgi:hypothetical protein